MIDQRRITRGSIVELRTGEHVEVLDVVWDEDEGEYQIEVSPGLTYHPVATLRRIVEVR